jgi:sulfite reductase (NADPH) hemoprotein beta-component
MKTEKMETGETIKLSAVEIIKEKSNYLRGTIVEGLNDPLTGAISDDDTQLTKFHGFYQQQDRDLEIERRKQKLEPYYMFMLRIRVPGGVASPSQWFTLDRLSDQYANGTIKLTTRQAFQFHGVLKRHLQTVMKGINSVLMDSIAACGDVNRNVMCSTDVFQTEIHKAAFEDSKRISAHLTPATSAYNEIWLGKKTEKEDNEPIYGKTYLPRKFKIAIAIPPRNDTDVYAHDLGLVAISDNGKLLGYNVLVGGGMGTSFGKPDTYPRLGDVIGFCSRENVVDVAEKVVLVQRDNGNRSNRKTARLKYTIDRMGLDNFKNELNKRLGYELEPAKPFQFTSNGDYYGWKKGINGKWSCSLFIEGGRVRDTEKYKLKSGLREIALFHDGEFRLTPNQNLVIANISEVSKPKIASILAQYNIIDGIKTSALRLNSMACVALNSCGLANAESERYLPTLVTKIEKVLGELGLQDEPITIRMTGCPNGCARPYLAEIAFVGKGAGSYNMYLGGGFHGQRLNNLFMESVGEEEILGALQPLLKSYAEERSDGERFGDFVIRKGVVKEIKDCKAFVH